MHQKPGKPGKNTIKLQTSEFNDSLVFSDGCHLAFIPIPECLYCLYCCPDAWLLMADSNGGHLYQRDSVHSHYHRGTAELGPFFGMRAILVYKTHKVNLPGL